MQKKTYNTVSLPSNELNRLREIAEQEHRSMAQQIIYWMEQHSLNKLQKEAS